MSNNSPSQAKLENDIIEARERLAVTIDQLTTRAAPKNVVARQTEAAKASFTSATHTPTGELRTDRLIMAAAAVGTLLVLKMVRSRRREAKWAKQRAKRSW